MPGPTFLQVGERSPNDPKYQTREVVMAAPGTVVAPMPRGMKPTRENAIMLVLMQLMKAAQGGVKKAQQGFFIEEGPSVPSPRAVGFQNSVFNPGTYEGPEAAAPSAPAAPRRASSSGGGGGGRGGRSLGPSNDPYQSSALANQLAGILSNYKLGSGRLSLDQLVAGQNYGLAREAGQRQGQQFESDIALRRLLGLEGIAATREGNLQQFQLGNRSIANQEVSTRNQLQLGTRSLDLQQASDEFARLMRGVSEASVGGVRGGGTPTQALFR